MAYRVTKAYRECSPGLDGLMLVLEDQATGARAELWPALGFNCLGWTVPLAGRAVDVLWSSPDVWTNPIPTRSGIPILVPFPNRIRDGRYSWAGKDYQLPRNFHNQHAIHGFAVASTWTVLATSSDGAACATATFRSSVEGAASRSLWPADYEVTVQYKLRGFTLGIELTARNPNHAPLPFGAGLHPYFRCDAAASVVTVLPPRGWSQGDYLQHWPLAGNLPAGPPSALSAVGRRLVPGPASAPIADLQFDDLYRVLPGPAGPTPTEVHIRQPDRDVTVRLTFGERFRDLVIFTPPHRQAVCVEPYTCVTNAVNLQDKGYDTGLMVLQPGEAWTGSVTFEVQPGTA